MAYDEVEITEGSGTPVAVDIISGRRFQRIKFSHGAEGSATDVSTTSPLPARLFDADLNNSVNITNLRDLQVAQRYTLWFDSLADGVSGGWTQSVANGGTVASTTGEGQLKTSTATNGSSQIVGPTHPYIAGRQEWFNSAIRLGDTGVAGNIRRWGKYTVSGTTPQDGFYYELSGTTLNAVTVRSGVATAVALASWTLAATNPFTLDANYHQWEIRYTANTVWFLVDGTLRHVAGGSTSAPITNTLTLPIAATNIKTSGATDITLAIRNIGTGGFGTLPGGVVETGVNAVPALAVGGGTPHDAVDSGNPLSIGGRALSGSPSAVADGDRVRAWFTTRGEQVVALTRPATAYFYNIPSQVHVNSASTVHWDIFNADATLVVRILSIRQIPNITTAVTGVVFDWLLERTTAVGTGGSTLTAWLADLNDTALDSDITARSKPTGGATQSTDLFNYSLSSEETNAATIQVASQGGLELVPDQLRPAFGGKGIVLRQNQGIRCVQVTASAAGNTGWLISFIVE